MLKQTRLTSAKSTRRLLLSSLNVVARRALASFFPLFLLANDAAFAVDGALRDTPTQSQDARQPLLNNRLQQPLESSQNIASELAQLEFQFQEARKTGSERVDDLTSQISDLLDKARNLATQAESRADEKLVEQAETFVSQVEEFQRFLNATSVFFRRLAELDAASLDEKATRSFFESFLERPVAAHSSTPYFNEVSDSSDSLAATLATYRAELNRASASLNALQTIENWNDFIEVRGSLLERFYVAPDAAENALEFISQLRYRQGLPKEYRILERRAAEWRFTSLNRVAIQRKILLALEAETATKYWTFAATPDRVYYLPQPPRPGRNVCFADAQGARAFVDIPAQAPETSTSTSAQRVFLQELENEARAIPETLRADDAARWYAAWSAFLSRLQTADALDPLVQFRLLHSVATILSTGDYHFAQRLAPTLRMLDIPRLADADALDVFKTENTELQSLRNLARSRIAFLPTDRLTVDKTTEQLDAQTERFSFVYRRVGWLDRDFSGAWRCRRPESAPLPVGDLYVLLLDENAPTNDVSTTSASSSRFRWLKIGSSDGRQTTLKFAAPNVSLGSIVLCRSRIGSTAPIAERGELERLLRR
ncbi:MAG: hypothetical protein IJE97_05220 [Thermoguttaceae bacterium]|nr:hypothetical protein [Thermoguttaceae bacterium]MBQ7110075.1 hypothetical protein [Thermoguttaceae bacterium]